MDDSFKEHIHFFEQIPFNKYLGIKVDALEKGFVRLVLPFRPEFVGDMRRRALHGGLVSTLVDTCGGAAVWSCCHIDDAIATIDVRVDYLRPAPEDDLVAEGTVKLLGNRVGNVHVKVHSAKYKRKVLAEGRGVYNIRRNNVSKKQQIKV